MAPGTPEFTIPPIEDASVIRTGDMPGDKVEIGTSHVSKARAIFPRLWQLVQPALKKSPHRAVISVHGGSGVGKSEIGSLLAHYLRENGVGSYVMSGDNYPRRIPRDNDAERLRVFRTVATKALATQGDYTDQTRDILAGLQSADRDSDPSLVEQYPWLGTYQRPGSQALAAYLGTNSEVDFDEVNNILAAFRDGAPELLLKRMGRSADQLWYEPVNMRDVQVLVIEWTHGNNDLLHGVDIPILLNSTPEETLAHRRSRARDGAVDSPFVTMVLALEQHKLHSQAHRAAIIVSKSGELLDYNTYLRDMGWHLPGSGAMLNVYPDSIGGTVGHLVEFMAEPSVAGVFESAYLLPSIFNSDLDRGFSVIDYNLNELYTTPDDLADLSRLGVNFKFDFILNHASVLSPQFQDLLTKGEKSQYRNFFIDWNAFWDGMGDMTADGYVLPYEELMADMFFRKPGLPILMVRMPDGTEKPYWNTFYQEVRYTVPDPQDVMAATGLQYSSAAELASRLRRTIDVGKKPEATDFSGMSHVKDAMVEWMESRRRYLGQMDLNIKSPLVWSFYADTLDKLAGYGAEIVRLDAFAYAPKEPGETNFLNDPGTWILLDEVKRLANQRGVKLLPEIHSRYEEKIHEVIAEKGFMTYDFFLPGLLIHAFETGNASVLKRWINDLLAKQIHTVNMLGCHDGIPLLDLKGLLEDEQIDHVIEVVKGRGGHVKDLHGATKIYYQVNATYFSALGESEQALLLARAIQMFMPGKPQVWYLDLFAGTNDHAAVERAGAGGHKEINRTNLTMQQISEGLSQPVVSRQLDLIRFRNEFPAFGFDAECELAQTPDEKLEITWRKNGHTALLTADLVEGSFLVTGVDDSGNELYRAEA